VQHSDTCMHVRVCGHAYHKECLHQEVCKQW
jgi:hypothetical protein